MPVSDYCGPRPVRGRDGRFGPSAEPTRPDGAAPSGAPVCNGYGRRVRLPIGTALSVGGEQGAQDRLVSVLGGAVKGYVELASGQRLIVGFRFAGEVLLVPLGDVHPLLMVEALTPAEVQHFGGGELSQLRKEHPQLDQKLWLLSYREHSRVAQHMLRLGCMDATARVASFLLEMRQHLTGPGSDGNSLWLPMARQDIAEYLGLKPETVSRRFTRLRKAGIIDTPSPKHVIVKDGKRLRALAGITDSLGSAGLDRRHAPL